MCCVHWLGRPHPHPQPISLPALSADVGRAPHCPLGACVCASRPSQAGPSRAARTRLVNNKPHDPAPRPPDPTTTKRKKPRITGPTAGFSFLVCGGSRASGDRDTTSRSAAAAGPRKLPAAGGAQRHGLGAPGSKGAPPPAIYPMFAPPATPPRRSPACGCSGGTCRSWRWPRAWRRSASEPGTKGRDQRPGPEPLHKVPHAPGSGCGAGAGAGVQCLPFSSPLRWPHHLDLNRLAGRERGGRWANCEEGLATGVRVQAVQVRPPSISLNPQTAGLGQLALDPPRPRPHPPGTPLEPSPDVPVRNEESALLRHALGRAPDEGFARGSCSPTR